MKCCISCWPDTWVPLGSSWGVFWHCFEVVSALIESTWRSRDCIAKGLLYRTRVEATISCAFFRLGSPGRKQWGVLGAFLTANTPAANRPDKTGGSIRGAYQWGTPPSHLDLVFSGPKYPRRLIPLSTPYHIHITSIPHPYQIHIRSISDPYQIHIKSISNPYQIHMNIWEGRGYPIERVPH